MLVVYPRLTGIVAGHSRLQIRLMVQFFQQPRAEQKLIRCVKQAIWIDSKCMEVSAAATATVHA